MLTSPDDLWSPDAGDTSSTQVITAAMQDSVQDALNSVRLQARNFSGTDAARVEATPLPGDYWTTTDTTPQRGYVGTASGWQLDRILPTAFTPSISNLLPGSGSISGTYEVGGGRVFGRVSVTLGTGFALNANGITFTAPLTPSIPIAMQVIGNLTIVDSGTGFRAGGVLVHQDTTEIGMWAPGGDSNWLGAVNGTGNPIGFSAGDQLIGTFNYRVA